MKYLKKCALMALAVLLPFAAWLSLLIALPDHLGNTIAATIRYKIDLLQDTPAPRIIFAGGSSSPYGTVCQTVADELGVNAICVGATAYLGIPYYLQMLDQYAQPGDVLVLAPEHSLLRGESINYELVWEAVGQDADAWRCVPLPYLPGLFCSSAAYFGLKQERLNLPDPGPNPDFGPLGDVTAPRTALLERGYNADDPIELTAAGVYEKNLTRINRFAARQQARGVTVLFAFAPTDRLAITSAPADIAAFEKTVTDGLDIPVILGLNTTLMDGRYFYDSNNHLTSEGAAINTQNLIAGLRGYGGF